MEKKTGIKLMVVISALVIGAASLALLPNSLLRSLGTGTGEYQINFDATHNDHYSKSSYNGYYNFTAITERGTELAFRERSIYDDTEGGWKEAASKGELLNVNPINGMTSITVNYSTYDDEYDSYINVKYGFVCGYVNTGGYANSPLNKYEDTLISSETFDFNDKYPSYLYLQFVNVHIESISINFDCNEHLPDLSDEDRYTLVTSLDDINEDDVYAIGNTTSGSGYMMSTQTWGSDDKSRRAVAVSVSNQNVAYDENILQLKITQEAGYYYFETLNYSGTNGYFYTLQDNNKNNLYIDSVNKSEIALSMDSTSYALSATHSYIYSGNNKTKYLGFYTDAQNTHFCFFKGTQQPIYLYKYIETTSLTKTINYSSVSSMSTKYNTGNYGSLANSGTTYEYYRTIRGSSSTYAFQLKNVNYYYGDNGYPSSFYNLSTSPIYGIKSISVTYKATSGIKIGYSKDIGDESYSTLGSASDYVTETVTPLEKMNFFKVMSNGSDAYIKQIDIVYNNNVTTINNSTSYTGNRKAYTTYSGTLVDGVTTKTMYISSSETKTYTYFSKQYAYDNYSSIDKSKAFMIDPVDVCNYYLAFHEYPANYVTSGEKSTYGSKFGSYARQISTYSRTDGYATSVPYNCVPGQSKPVYYELDIDVDGSYSLSSRQVGRVVIWEYGFSCYTDGTSIAPVCVYTDDHYATFQEYDCMGGFAHRFNGERTVTNKVHTPLTLVA